MKRWVTSKIIGTGGLGDAYRPAIDDITDPARGGAKAYNTTNVFPPQNPDGTFTRPYALTLADGPNWRLAAQHPDCDVLFSQVEDTVRLDSLETGVTTKVLQALSARGATVSAISGATSAREAIDKVGKELDANFDVLFYDV